MYAKSLGEWGVAEMFAPLVPVPLDVLIAISSLWFMSTAVTLLFFPPGNDRSIIHYAISCGKSVTRVCPKHYFKFKFFCHAALCTGIVRTQDKENNTVEDTPIKIMLHVYAV